MTHDDGDFLRKIIAGPAEDTPRLVYADWLQENDQESRANAIRWMVDKPLWFADATCLEASDYSQGYLSALDWLKGGSADAELHEQLGGAWAGVQGMWVWHRGQLVDQEFRVSFARGFISDVTCTAADWLTHGDAIRAAHPVTRVVLSQIDERLIQLTYQDSPVFSSVHLAHPPLVILRKGLDLMGQVHARDNWARGMCFGLFHLRWPGVTFELPRATSVQEDARLDAIREEIMRDADHIH